MKRLLTIEWYKLRSYTVAWVMVALFVLLAFMLYMWFAQTRDEMIPAGSGLEQLFPLYRFPDIWQFLPFIVTNFANPFLGVLIIILVGNEIQYRTLRQSVIHGLSRSEAWASKAYLILVLAGAATVMLFLLGLLFGFVFGGGESAGDSPLARLDFLLGYFLSTCGFLFVALWLGLALQRGGLAIGLYVFWVLMLEPMISSMINFLIKDGAGDYLPITAFKSVYGLSFALMLEGSSVTNIFHPITLVTVLYTGFFAWHSWWLVRKGAL